MKTKKLEVSVVAQQLSVSTSTVYRLIDLKKLKAGRMGVKAGIRVCSESVEAYKKSRVVGTD